MYYDCSHLPQSLKRLFHEDLKTTQARRTREEIHGGEKTPSHMILGEHSEIQKQTLLKVTDSSSKNLPGSSMQGASQTQPVARMHLVSLWTGTRVQYSPLLWNGF